MPCDAGVRAILCPTAFADSDCETLANTCESNSSCDMASKKGESVKHGCADIDTSSDDESVDDAEIMATTRWHLELMNTAAEDTNIVQNTLNMQQKEKHLQMKMWAIKSFQLACSMNAKHLATAGPWLAADRALRNARKEVGEASEQYKEALEAGASENEVIDLEARHARSLVQYQHAQHLVCQLQHTRNISPALVATLRPYLEAEEEQLARLAEIDSDIEKSMQQLQAAKERYRNALRSLEELSEETHQRRAEKNELVLVA